MYQNFSPRKTLQNSLLKRFPGCMCLLQRLICRKLKMELHELNHTRLARLQVMVTQYPLSGINDIDQLRLIIDQRAIDAGDEPPPLVERTRIQQAEMSPGGAPRSRAAPASWSRVCRRARGAPPRPSARWAWGGGQHGDEG